MNLKKLYVDALLGNTLREFRKGRKYIGGPDDEENTEYKLHFPSRRFGANSPRLQETIGLGARKKLS